MKLAFLLCVRLLHNYTMRALLLFVTVNVLMISSSFSQDTLKKYLTVRTSIAPKIDGVLDDECWKSAEKHNDFVQNRPIEGNSPSQKTEVQIVYDDYGIYVGAMLYDTSPDSILHELGFKDDEGLNADRFDIRIDPFNTRQDAYIFGVYASGVQYDNKFSDWTYSAVWHSSVKITDKGWCVEMRIPYMALRFPNSKTQTWALQFTRDIRRHREFIQWCLTPSKVANSQKLWGTLYGIEKINPPLRLSLNPYLTFYAERSPLYTTANTYQYVNGSSILYGADLKYGINESFTIDMTLLPDFSQVQSDRKIRNLTYREINYDENRPFFKEGTELFDKNGMFYSRRIGATPSMFYSLPYTISPTEKIISNPSQSQLLNATKLTGRTPGGLGIGIINAVTNNTYASVVDTISGETKKILTEPLSNFNVVVFDQQLKNNSNVYFINTNVIRNCEFSDANVSAFGYRLQNKKNTLFTEGNFCLSQNFSSSTLNADVVEDKIGYSYFLGIKKIGGSFEYGMGTETVSPNYDRTDMGFFNERNYKSVFADIQYNLYQPWKKIRTASIGLEYSRGYNFVSGKLAHSMVDNNNYMMFLNFFSVFWGGGFATEPTYDYFEPRVAGRYYLRTPYYYLYAGFSTDYRKKLAIDLSANCGNFIGNYPSNFPQLYGYGIKIAPRYRFSNQLSLKLESKYDYDPYNDGFVDIDNNDEIIFGGRELVTYENSANIKYIFKNDMSISGNCRHYWFKVKYIDFYTLGSDGLLFENNQYNLNRDFSYNYFTVDIVYSWQFLPGSFLTASYKNIIETEDIITNYKFGENLNHTLDAPQRNSITLKLLYFLDYQLLKNRRHKTV